jgi:hypothetical protein
MEIMFRAFLSMSLSIILIVKSFDKLTPRIDYINLSTIGQAIMTSLAAERTLDFYWRAKTFLHVQQTPHFPEPLTGLLFYCLKYF